MVSRSVLFSCQGVVIVGAALTIWALGVNAAVHRYDSATPHTPARTPYKYIPVRSNYYDNAANLPAPDNSSKLPGENSSWSLSPVQLILTILRTILDVIKNVNASRQNTPQITHRNKVYSRKPLNRTVVEGRGFYDEYDDHHYHDTTTTTTTPKPVKQGRYTDPWAGYYDWIINEGSFKFWSVFQLFTAALLLYSCFSAIYYARFNPIIPDYSMEYDDYFLERTSTGRKARSLEDWELPSGLKWINPRTFQFILDSISTYNDNKLDD